MLDRTKEICCLVISIVGWLIFFGGLIYAMVLPFTISSDFSMFIAANCFIRSSIAAIVIHAVNFIFGIIIFVLKKGNKQFWFPGLLISFVFISIFAISLICIGMLGFLMKIMPSIIM